MQEDMTDYQLDTFIRMTIELIKASSDKQEAIDKLEALLKDKRK